MGVVCPEIRDEASVDTDVCLICRARLGGTRRKGAGSLRPVHFFLASACLSFSAAWAPDVILVCQEGRTCVNLPKGLFQCLGFSGTFKTLSGRKSNTQL